MLLHLIKKEFLDSLLNQRFMLLAVFSIILMPMSAWINYEYYDARKEAFDSQYANFTTSEDAINASRAYRAPALLSPLARGNEPYMPIYYSFNSAASGNQVDATSPGNIEAQDFAILSSFGSFDFLFLIQVVFSLLAILLAFDMIAGEKERGTLKAVLANSVPRDKLIISKFLGGFTVLWLTFLIGFLLLLLVLILFNGQFAEGQTLIRIAFAFFSSTLFLAGFFGLGLMVSAFCHSSRTAIIILLVAWVMMQLVIPKAGEMIATVVRPIQSEHQVRLERQKIIAEELATLDDKAGDLFSEITGISAAEKAFLHIRTSDPTVSQFRDAYQAAFKASKQAQNDRMRAVAQTWQRERDLQRTLGNLIALISPASALTMLVSDIAGTGDLAYHQYREAVANQYQIVDREFFSKMESNSYRINIGGAMLSGNFGEEAASPEAIPPFTVPQPSLSEIIKTNIWPLITLFCYLIVPFLIAYTRFLKYDAR
ncbi:MAG: ABC transporter permease subunit [Rhodothermales bacterium]